MGLLYLYLYLLDAGGWSTPRPGRFTPGKDPSTHCVGGWGAPELVWKGAENLAPTGIRSPDRPACTESLYRPSCPAHQAVLVGKIEYERPISLSKCIAKYTQTGFSKKLDGKPRMSHWSVVQWQKIEYFNCKHINNKL